MIIVYLVQRCRISCLLPPDDDDAPPPPQSPHNGHGSKRAPVSRGAMLGGVRLRLSLLSPAIRKPCYQMTCQAIHVIPFPSPPQAPGKSGGSQSKTNPEDRDREEAKGIERRGQRGLDVVWCRRRRLSTSSSNSQRLICRSGLTATHSNIDSNLRRLVDHVRAQVP